MKEYIDLRSDTVTRPSPEMLVAMFEASVGDDVFGDDPTVNLLEDKVAGMFGHEAALFCPSGTMTNQVAIKVHTQPGDEIICEQGSHVYRYEGGGLAFNSGCSVRLVQGDHGRITSEQVAANINPDNVHYPRTSLVVAENTSNRGGGSVYDIRELKRISEVCQKNGLKFHLDGARLFNAIVRTGNSTREIGQLFDSVSICLSKGLGAPVGSVLTGNASFIKEARRKRKVFGGGMRQAGYLAAAGLFALENNVSRLEQDHANAQKLAQFLREQNFVESIAPVETNIIIFRTVPGISESEMLEWLKAEKVLAVDFGPGTIRMVTHLDVDENDLDRVSGAFKKIGKRI